MTSKPERIAKVIAAAGLCSRRDAEAWIEEGRVSVNGKKLSSPAMTVTADDKITVDGKPLRQKEQIRLWLYHKPVGLVTTTKDPQGRETVFDALPRSLGRVISVGRLDMNSEGLLLLTNSGALSRHLELPSTELPRYYQVRVYGDVNAVDYDRLRRGVTIDGIRYRGMEIERDTPHSRDKNQWLHIVLHEGKNREIRKVMADCGLHVSRLVRESYGPFELGDLPRGKVQEVEPRVLQAFFREIGFKP